MEIVFEELCTFWTSMTIHDSKEVAIGPLFGMLFVGRFLGIDYDGDSIFIIVSDESLVCADSESLNWPMWLFRGMSGFRIWKSGGSLDFGKSCKEILCWWSIQVWLSFIVARFFARGEIDFIY